MAALPYTIFHERRKIMDMDYVLASLNPPSVWAFYPTAEAAAAKADIINEYGTFQNRAKVVDSLPGDTMGIAGCRHNPAPRAKRSMRLNFSTDGTIRRLQSPVVGGCSLKHLEALRSLGLESLSAASSTSRCGPRVEAVSLRAECHGL